MIGSRRTMRLGQLVPDVIRGGNLEVSGVATDSRKVASGDLFLAVPGITSDGRMYIRQALDSGAVAVLFNRQEINRQEGFPEFPENVIGVDGLEFRVGDIASHYYGNPSEKMDVFGVTGTNGKTSCTHYLAQALNQLGHQCGVVGSLGYGLIGSLKPLQHTTPDAVTFQRCLAEILDSGADSVCFEASSHGLAQGRLSGTRIDLAVFTNLSRDHLDYHADLRDYFASKRRLFDLPGLQTVIINIDDEHGRLLRSELDGRFEIISYSISERSAQVSCSGAHFSPLGTIAIVSTPWGEGELRTSLLGEFNLSNVLAVLSILCARGHALPAVLTALESLRNVRGRMDLLRHEGKADVVVDYAHTPDALSKALIALRPHCRGLLWCVFGCGGDRDRGKRREMGEVAWTLSDVLVITTDNPRSEVPAQIIEGILSGVGTGKRVIIEEDRSKAILSAIAEAGCDDLLLIAGKGHEEYQESMGRRLPFSDYEEISRAVG